MVKAMAGKSNATGPFANMPTPIPIKPKRKCCHLFSKKAAAKCQKVNATQPIKIVSVRQSFVIKKKD